MRESIFKEIFDSVHIVQDPVELYWLINLVEETRPRIIIEIGVEDGGSLKFWERLLPEGGLLVGIDISDSASKVAWDWRKSNREIHFVQGDSKNANTLLNVHKILGKREADFLFIDGEHSEEAIQRDFSLYSRFVRSGGLVGFHDIFFATNFFKFLTGIKYFVHNKIGTGVWVKF